VKRLALVSLLGLAGAAAAQPAPDPQPPVAAFLAQQLVLRLAAELGSAASLAPDAWFALNDRFRLGLTTSTDARRQLGSGRGICIRGCTVGRFAGAAADAEVRLGPTLVGRAALDATRFVPTAVAVEVGGDSVHTSGPWTVEISPVLRIGVARRDLANGDTAALFARLRARAWTRGGLGAAARVAFSLDALRDTPSFGAAFEAWHELDRITLSARIGMAELARSFVRDSLFAELAITLAI
jgi:hypothetical protein